MSVAGEARTEAERRWAVGGGPGFPSWSQAFVSGAEWQASHPITGERVTVAGRVSDADEAWREWEKRQSVAFADEAFLAAWHARDAEVASLTVQLQAAQGVIAEARSVAGQDDAVVDIELNHHSTCARILFVLDDMFAPAASGVDDDALEEFGKAVDYPRFGSPPNRAE